MSSPWTGYLAAPGRVEDLARELGRVERVHGRLLLAPGPPRPASWAANTWYEPLSIRVDSIGQAVRALRALQRNWALYAHGQHRRAHLIEEQLPGVSARPLRFGDPRPAAPLGSWTLLDAHTLLAAPRCSSAFPHGEPRFVEDREAPPSRAYLKLWEAFTLLDERPQPGQLCLDLGSSPGGWTWVLAQLGCRVISVDKAPLEPRVAALPGVEYRAQSAFALQPDSIEAPDWLCCDIACYPARLLELVRRWLDSGRCRRFVCTVKLQGPAEPLALAELAALPDSRLVHLAHNKHELTWLRLPGLARIQEPPPGAPTVG